MTHWINFVKLFADKNNLNYKDAVTSGKCREEYQKVKVKLNNIYY